MPQKDKNPQDRNNALALLLVIASIILGFTTSVLANAAYRAIDILEDDQGNLTATVTLVIFLFLGLSIIFIAKLALAYLRDEEISLWRILRRKWRRDLILVFLVIIFSVLLSVLLWFPIYYERTILPMLEAAQ